AVALMVLGIAAVACSVGPEPLPTAIRVGGFLSADMPRCGPPIGDADVLVVDTEGAESLSPDLAARIGPFELADERPLSMKLRPNGQDVAASARRVVARQGCDLLLLGTVKEESRIVGDGISGSRQEKVSYLLFHMGQRNASNDLP
ncbi:MAG: hypothetical protein HKO85_09950, partial [Xanthomonadales bacterium]|nr:hypothetical protein [Gammaproteobacteria bacterium]MBT8056512.1 hypothetical protein [Gammaproteobacteria bacterium]NNL05599.1 hypothetical protein [Xanthomonadales bacterium]